MTNGIDGFTGDDAQALRLALLELLEDADRAREIGARGRNTVERLFPIERFRAQWNGLLASVCRS